MTSARIRQTIRFLRTTDGVKLAWAETGKGPALVKAANWMTHLEFDCESPVWRHWIRFFGSHFRFIRYDERGCGLTDWEVDDLSPDRWVADLEEVSDTAVPRDPFVLLGISHGAATCIAYAIRHPERVSRMILYGGYSRGYAHRRNADSAREYGAIVELARTAWAKDNPAFRQVFTSRFIPEGTPEQIRWFNELCRKTTSPEMASRLLTARAQLDVHAILQEVRVPTLVIHARDDNVVTVREGHRLASGIPGAEFVELDSKNHVLLEHEPAWRRFHEAVLEFTGAGAIAGHAAFAALSPRERQVLVLMTEGLANAQIGTRLSISEKTVRNHVSSIFDKLGVWTRAQAMVFARDHGFHGL
ncbi:MAG TPA: alpha/beta fold hydrolase [Thermoanaerobaculia bacterium]|nr:alpha/beta fold hydrolase [Thermoanaerobaculia bacterium]